MVRLVKHGMVWYVMVCYVSKQKHRNKLGTFGSDVERLEAFWKRLNAFRAFGSVWQRSAG